MYFHIAFLTLGTAIASASAIPATMRFASLSKRESGTCDGKFGDSATGTFGDFTGCTSSFSDGQGTYVTSKDTHHYASGVKCWTDLFYVSESVYYADYDNTGYAVDCTLANAGDQCSQEFSFSNQTCTTTTLSASVSFDIVGEILGVSADVSAESTTENCYSESVNYTCTAAQGSKLCLELSKQRTAISGYIRRRCGNGGDHTVWSKDYTVDAPAEGMQQRCAAC